MTSNFIRKIAISFFEDIVFINKRKHKTKRKLFFTWIIENGLKRIMM